MGAPLLPAISLRTFAADANFAAGVHPWNSQPTKVEPPGGSTQGFTPGTGAGSPFVNKVVNDLCNQDTALLGAIDTLYSYLTPISGTNWYARSVAWRTLISGGTHLGCAGVCYSDKLRSWFSVVIDSGNNRIYLTSTQDPVGPWTSLGFVATVGGAATNVSIPVAHATTGFVLSMFGQAGSQAKFAKSTGGVTTLITPASLAAAGSVAAGTNGMAALYFNGQCLYFTALGADLGTIINTPDSSTYSKVSYAVNSSRAPWLAAASGAICVAISGYYIGIGNVINYQTSTDGTTWTTGSTIPTQSGAPEQPRAICYSAETGLFTLITAPPTLGQHYVYTSPDGTTWTYRSTFNLTDQGNAYGVVSVAACGALLVAAFPTAATVSAPGATTRVIFSPDAGTTWLYRSDTLDEPNDSLSANSSILGHVVASGDRFVLTTELGLRVSLRAGTAGTVTL